MIIMEEDEDDPVDPDFEDRSGPESQPQPLVKEYQAIPPSKKVKF